MEICSLEAGYEDENAGLENMPVELCSKIKGDNNNKTRHVKEKSHFTLAKKSPHDEDADDDILLHSTHTTTAIHSIHFHSSRRILEQDTRTKQVGIINEKQ